MKITINDVDVEFPSLSPDSVRVMPYEEIIKLVFPEGTEQEYQVRSREKNGNTYQCIAGGQLEVRDGDVIHTWQKEEADALENAA